MSNKAVSIGSRLELFVDDFLIDALSGGASLKLHHPIPREVIFRLDAPWEGNACSYASLVPGEGGGYRLYYHGLHYRTGGPETLQLADHPGVLCFIESDDGLTWRRPELGLYEFGGSRANNIVMTEETVTAPVCDPLHTAVLRDDNPDCPPEARYKIVSVGWKAEGLFVLQSPDGLTFTLAHDEPAVTGGAFDSQNLMFWDPAVGLYREYHRGFNEGRRDILTATSADPLHFPPGQWLRYTGAPDEQLYTNQIAPYYRAPHILMGFPARYQEREWSEPLYRLPDLGDRLARATAHERYGSTVTDGVFMTSRDGLSFHRWPEAFIRPGPRTKGSWVYGDIYSVWGMIETPSALEDAPPELSLYMTDDYWQGTDTAYRRYTLRIDGFVSLNAPLSGGEVITRPVVFAGGSLALNLETSGAGGVRVGLLDEGGHELEGYGVDDCPEIMGDTLRHLVCWKERGRDLRSLAGRPLRLRFVVRDADLYSFQFVPYAGEPDPPDLTGITLPTRG